VIAGTLDAGLTYRSCMSASRGQIPWHILTCGVNLLRSLAVRPCLLEEET
jgi:hypothetical protein